MNEAIKSGLLEELEKNGKLIYTNFGDSMLPFIRQGRDLLLIERPAGWETLPEDSLTEKLKKYDIPLYKRDNGRFFVLHRVLAVKKDGYVLCGDNRRHKEHGINDRHVYGVLTAIIRDGKMIPVTDLRYRIYVHLWCDFFPVRAGILFLRDIWRRITT